MPEKLLITLRSADLAKTFSYDSAAQSALWLGLKRRVTPENALLRLEEGSEGDAISLRVIGGGLIRCDGQEGSCVDIPSSGECIATLMGADGSTITVFIRPALPGLGRYHRIAVADGTEIGIGRAGSNAMCYDSPFVSAHHARIAYRGGGFSVADLGSSNGTLVNGKAIKPRQQMDLKPGDVVQVVDLIMGIGKRFIVLNEPPQLMISIPRAGKLSREVIEKRWPDAKALDGDPIPFYPAPRLAKSIHPLKMTVDDPPAKKEPNNQPVIMAIGPSFLMAFGSIFMAVNSVSRFAEGAGIIGALPSIFMALAMICGSVVWPIISRRYNQKKDARDEALRSNMYVAYLDNVETRLYDETDSQAQALNENLRPVGELLERADSLSPLLMSHTSSQDDFLDLRVGIGDQDLLAEINWPQRHFSLADDYMLDRVTKLSQEPPMLRDVPIAFNPSKNFVTGVLGDRERAWSFLRGLLVQVCALYSYQEVKIVIVSSIDEMHEWDFLTSLGHFYDRGGVHRLVALSRSGMVEEDLMLERELAVRADKHAEVLADYGTYYLIVCSNQVLAEQSEALHRLMQLRTNKGFSLVYLGKTLRDLPRECGYIIDLAEDGGANLGISLGMKRENDRQRARKARMFERTDVSGSLRQFDPDIMVTRDQAHVFANSLSRARLDELGQHLAMPGSVGFLEMFEVGNVAHLNIGQRWAENDAAKTLEVPIGIDEQGDHALLNLHENIHGPHGLIAGTTGSGKSEFIITYILSMCVNYAPDEVAFVLIDYKGGGLAGAFENERHHLPHLAGTITNLDGNAIHRSLVSIQSELKRRQDVFNRARDMVGESTMDIYKYLSYYRQGVLTEPLPHLFVVADEFAELKDQQPEFMDELISAARIGRSLGVHLILATQKPSGVVNDQIWSNSRFKVCLKVSDVSDSREMIKREDAAEITNPGRYYLLVGYNESFTSGQAAYAGGSYIPASEFEPKRDTAVELLDEEGAIAARMRPQVAASLKKESELEAVLGRIENAAEISGKNARRLWLDPLPDRIVLAELAEKYGAVPSDGYWVTIGEIDDPENQRQFRFAVELAEAGNILLYGSQNSGVEELQQAMLFSLAKEYGPEKLWIYAVDLGAGSLAPLAELPQCGGVVLPNDDERLENLMRMLDDIQRERQKGLAAYGGSIEAYEQSLGNVMPRVVIAISGLAALVELHPELEDALISLTREGPRYGIHFVVAAASANSVRMRLSTNFATVIPTMLNDANDYLSIMGSMRGIVPPHQERRGLTRIDKRILEFQGVSLSGAGQEVRELIGDLATRICEATSSIAPAIPQLPAYVHTTDMGEEASLLRMPVGFDKRTVAPVFFDLNRAPYYLVLGNDNDSIDRYLRGLHDALGEAQGMSYRFIDSQKLLKRETDDNVLTDMADIEEFVTSFCAGERACDVIVFTSIAQAVSELSPTVSRALQDYICEERGAGSTLIVCASEYWRVRSVYDNWYKVVSAYGNGLWCGAGFIDQTVFRFAHSRPEYRQPAARSDGFAVDRGEVVWVRLLEAQDEPMDVV